MGLMYSQSELHLIKSIFIRWCEMGLHTIVLLQLKKSKLIVLRRKRSDSQLIFNQKIDDFLMMRLAHELMRVRLILYALKYQNERKLSLMI